jgi:hypothetical protein
MYLASDEVKRDETRVQLWIITFNSKEEANWKEVSKRKFEEWRRC